MDRPEAIETQKPPCSAFSAAPQRSRAKRATGGSTTPGSWIGRQSSTSLFFQWTPSCCCCYYGFTTNSGGYPPREGRVAGFVGNAHDERMRRVSRGPSQPPTEGSANAKLYTRGSLGRFLIPRSSSTTERRSTPRRGRYGGWTSPGSFGASETKRNLEAFHHDDTPPSPHTPEPCQCG